jgi:DNA polymerase III epsilon subunit-like protein
MIVFDTETTGFTNNPALPLDQQPEIIEFAAVKLDDDTMEEIGSLSFFLMPKRLIRDAQNIKATGITDDMLKGAPSFARKLDVITTLFLGETSMIAHNVSFDERMMYYELARLDRVTKFPWPSQHLCSVELNMDVLVKGERKLELLYKKVTGKEMGVKHRAMDDTRALVEIVRWMRTQGKL